MAQATIYITDEDGERTQNIEPGRPTNGHVTYEGDPKPTDLHVEYGELGSDAWTKVIDTDINPDPGVTPFEDFPVPFTAPSASGTYDFRVTWTFKGVADAPAPVTRTGQFFVRESSRCFVATAAYGSELAPRVQLLREIRDGELRQTRWGRDFFDEFERYYYRLSPAIAEQMRLDPRLRELMRWTIVTPWSNYLRLVREQPDWERLDLDALPSEVARFLELLRSDLEEWLDAVALPEGFRSRNPLEAARELGVIVRYRRASATAFLNGLIDRRELPLRFFEHERAELVDVLARQGCSPGHQAAILDGVPLGQE